jgi:uncharacterized membrane protein YbhN (UPF0104 family)
MNKAKVHKILSITLKTAVLLLSLGYIYFKIFYNQDMDKNRISFYLACESGLFNWYFFVLVLLMPLNWGIEIIKWRYLILKIENISFYKSLKAVLVGITFSSFTPNRVGDYFGRAFMLENSNKQEGFLITIVGSIAQTIITIMLGTIGLIWFRDIYLTKVFYVENISFYISLIVLIIINALILLFYFKISFFNTFVQKIRIMKRLTPYFQILSSYSIGELLKALILSLLRYIVFVFQFYLLLLIFNINIPFFDGFAVIAIIYLVTTIIPTIALTELGVKGAAAIYFFDLYFKHTTYHADEIAINVVAATFILWILNLALPAIMGCFYVFKMKPFKRTIDD